MTINPIQNYYRVQASANNAKKSVEESTAPTTETRGTDTIDISTEAGFKADLGKYAKVYAAKNAEGASVERISELKQQYQGDACPISGSDISAKIIAGILGPGVKD